MRHLLNIHTETRCTTCFYKFCVLGNDMFRISFQKCFGFETQCFVFSCENVSGSWLCVSHLNSKCFGFQTSCSVVHCRNVSGSRLCVSHLNLQCFGFQTQCFVFQCTDVSGSLRCVSHFKSTCFVFQASCFGFPCRNVSGLQPRHFEAAPQVAEEAH
jgi:hypothetical protein